MSSNHWVAPPKRVPSPTLLRAYSIVSPPTHQVEETAHARATRLPQKQHPSAAADADGCGHGSSEHSVTLTERLSVSGSQGVYARLHAPFIASRCVRCPRSRAAPCRRSPARPRAAPRRALAGLDRFAIPSQATVKTPKLRQDDEPNGARGVHQGPRPQVVRAPRRTSKTSPSARRVGPRSRSSAKFFNAG